MKVSVCRPSELNPSEIQRWNSFQRHNGRLGSPFLTPEFAMVMSEFRRDARLAVIEDGGKITGYLAFERNRWGIGRALCYAPSDVQGLVHAPGYEWNGAELLAGCGLTLWKFDHLISDQVECFAPQHAALRPAPMVDLSAGWENWIARKKSDKRIKKIREHE